MKNTRRFHRARRAVPGVSRYPLILSCLATPAVAQQAVPGDANCPRTGTEVVCTGNVPQGIVIVPTDGVERLILRDLVAPIAPAAGISGIDFLRTSGPIAVTVEASARGISVNDENGIELYSYDADIRLDNAAPITARSDSREDVYAIRAWVYDTDDVDDSDRARIDITNSAAIDVEFAPNLFGGTSNAHGISARIVGDGEINIANSGDIRVAEANDRVIAFGIRAAMTGRNTSITVVNDGAITIDNPVNGDGIDVSLFGLLRGGTANGTARIINNAPITGRMGNAIGFSGVTVGGVKGFTDLEIVNNGVIDIASEFDISDAIRVLDNASGNFRVTNTASITAREGAGAIRISAGSGFRDFDDYVPGVITVRNSGAISADGGVGILANGDQVDILNSAEITTLSGFGAHALSGGEWARILGQEGYRGRMANASRIENSGELSTAGTFSHGIDANFVGGGTILNRGSITTSGRESRGITVTLLTDVDVTNEGAIRVTGDEAAGVWFGEFSAGPSTIVLDPDFDADRDIGSRIGFSTTVDIIASGQDSMGIQVDAGNPNRAADEDAVAASYRGTSDILIPQGVTVSGGTGTGAGVRYIGYGTNTLDIRGTVTALSGNAIVGGTASEVILNRGRIEGAVSLGAGRDIYRHLAGGEVTGAIDLGDGDDDLVIENAAGLQGPIRLGAGNDRILIAPGVMFTNDVDGGDGDDRIVLDITDGTARRTDFATGNLVSVETVEKNGAGTLLLDEATFDRVLLNGGTLSASGPYGGTAVVAAAGTQLTAEGTLGAVTLDDGAVLSVGGDAAGSLTLGALTLSSASVLRMNLGTAGTVGGADNDHISVLGDLVLDGRLDILASPDFGIGVYRLIDYGGALTDNGLAIGDAPVGGYVVQTGIAGQVNLLVGEADDLSIQFWDGGQTDANGAIDGGAGRWSTGATNWTNADGTRNAAWAGNFAVFQGIGGAVQLDGVQSVTGLQFAGDGYRIEGGADVGIEFAAAQTILRVDPGNSARIDAPLSGSGALVKRDAGTLILGSASTYSGGTDVREGVVEVAADSALGAASGGITLDGGTLRWTTAGSTARSLLVGSAGGTIVRDQRLAWSGALSGDGILDLRGAGSFAYDGDGTAFGGRLLLSEGSLALGGGLGGALEVGAVARLTGTGQVNDLIIAGTVAPGNSIGIMRVTGNALFRAGSVYEAELAADGDADLLDIAGSATLEGGTVRVIALDPETQYVSGARYDILGAAGGLTGTFDGLSETSAFLDFTLGYDATRVFLTVEVIRTFPDVAVTFNQTQAASGLAAFGQAPGSDSLAVYNRLLLLDESGARAAFDAASGEIYAATVAGALRQGEGVLDGLNARGFGAVDEGWGLWGGVSGQVGRIAADGNGERIARNQIGGSLGIDYRGPGNAWALGFAAGGTSGDVTIDARASGADTSAWHVGGYARYGAGGAGFSMNAALAWIDGRANVDRRIAIGALPRTARARIDLDVVTVGAEARYGVAAGGNWTLGPLARFSYAGVDLGRFRETGADSLDLAGAGGGDSRTRIGIGGFLRHQSESGLIDASLAWVKGAGTTEVDLALAGASRAVHSVRSAVASSGVEAGLAGSVWLAPGWTFDLNARGRVGGAERVLQGNVALSWRF